MKRFGLITEVACAAIVTWATACTAPEANVLCPVPPGLTREQALAFKRDCYSKTLVKVLDSRSHSDVDILFVIANSPSMAPKQRALARAIPQFISRLEAQDLNYHVGVITTDLGYNPTPATGAAAPWNTLPSCNTYSGDDGVLQNIPCTSRAGLDGEGAAACAALCPDPKYVPENGWRFILKVDGLSNVPRFEQDGVDLGPQKAFQCLALVGSSGCAVAQPLAAVRRALDSQRADNHGFNRVSSVLAVIFITDEVSTERA